MREHLGRDMTSNCHHGLIAGLGLGKLSDGVMAQVMKSQAGQRTLDLVDIRAAFLMGVLLGRIADAHPLHKTRPICSTTDCVH